MTPDKAINEWDKLRSQIRLHRAMNADLPGILFFGMLLLGLAVACDTAKIVSPEVRRSCRIGSNCTNKDYLLNMVGYVLGTVLTVAPETVDYNNKVTLKMADPGGYAGLKTALDAAAMRLRQERVVTIWVPRKGEVSEQDKRVKINGELKTPITDELTSKREKGYLVEFTITTSGRLYVPKIKEIVKRDPSASRPVGN